MSCPSDPTRRPVLSPRSKPLPPPPAKGNNANGKSEGVSGGNPGTTRVPPVVPPPRTPTAAQNNVPPSSNSSNSSTNSSSPNSFRVGFASASPSPDNVLPKREHRMSIVGTQRMVMPMASRRPISPPISPPASPPPSRVRPVPQPRPNKRVSSSTPEGSRPLSPPLNGAEHPQSPRDYSKATSKLLKAKSVTASRLSLLPPPPPPPDRQTTPPKRQGQGTPPQRPPPATPSSSSVLSSSTSSSSLFSPPTLSPSASTKSLFTPSPTPGGFSSNTPDVSELCDFMQALLASVKKISGSNIQLKYVSESASEKLVSEKQPAMKISLGMAIEDVRFKNESLKRAMSIAHEALAKQEVTVNTIYTLTNVTTEVAKSTSFLVAAGKAVTLDLKSDKAMFAKMLTATTTVYTSLENVIARLGSAPDGLDLTDCIQKLGDFLKAVESALSALTDKRTAEDVVPLYRQLELEAAARASVAGLYGLVRCVQRPVQARQQNQTLSEMAKIAASTTFQLLAACKDITSALPKGKARDLLTAKALKVKGSYGLVIAVLRAQAGATSAIAGPAVETVAETHRANIHEVMVTTLMLARLDPAAPSHVPSSEDREAAALIVDVPTPVVPDPPEDLRDRTATTSFGVTDSSQEINIWDEPADNPDNIVLKEDQRIKYANLNKLVENLTSPKSHDLKYMKTFITTYRSFTSSDVFVHKMMERYYNQPDSVADQSLSINLRLCNVLKFWIECQSFENSPELFAKVTEFVDDLAQNQSLTKFIASVQLLVSKKLSTVQLARSVPPEQVVDLPLEPKINLSPPRLLTVFDEAEMGIQLTLVESRIYTAIQPVELLNQAWNKTKLKHRSPNVLRLISRSTILTRWVVSTILWQPTLKERTRTLSKLINIALHLRKLGNFNSLMAIIAGMNHASVHRLKHTKEALPQSLRKNFEELNELMNPNQAYSVYRSALHNVDPPCIPFLGVYLTDLTFIDDGNPDRSKDGLINFSKREMEYNVIAEVQQYQQVKYPFKYVENIAHFLSELPYNNDDELYKLSLRHEPRGASVSDIN
eukprot:TRINITY_DN16657_c0_g1_i1.p1 TRINITY_DN16657_c0_g1~~TRINITY_DN16657_c0_g1_i1.p1  ORF type:complete len:1049 (+),score=228.63 TRINITY_DN16657_c0_g1_i1:400-3546(+)